MKFIWQDSYYFLAGIIIPNVNSVLSLEVTITNKCVKVMEQEIESYNCNFGSV